MPDPCPFQGGGRCFQAFPSLGSFPPVGNMKKLLEISGILEAERHKTKVPSPGEGMFRDSAVFVRCFDPLFAEEIILVCCKYNCFNLRERLGNAETGI